MVPRFIVLEGPDGSGTTTHAALLAERLRRDGSEVLLTAEPTNGPVGKFLRTALSVGGMPADALQLLFSADRAWHVEAEIGPALKRGATVISDRYALSTIAYGKALGLEEQWLSSLGIRFVQPDMQIILLPPSSVCMNRWKRRSKLDILEKEPFQHDVHEQYRLLAKQHGMRVVDTSGDKDDVADRIYAIVSSHA